MGSTFNIMIPVKGTGLKNGMGLVSIIRRHGRDPAIARGYSGQIAHATAGHTPLLALRIIIFGVATCAIFACSAHADNWAPNLHFTATSNDNATNADKSSDRIAALQTNADLGASKRFGVGRNDSLYLTAHVAVVWWPRFTGLHQAGIGGRLEWQHKFGLGALAPVFSAEFAVDEVIARENGRKGTSSGVTFTLRKRLNDVLRAKLTQEFTDHDARVVVFDRTGAETALEIDRDVSDVMRFSFRASYRDGDVVSYNTPPRPELVPLAPNRTPVSTFGRSMMAYSIDARTIGLRAAVTRTLNERTIVILDYEWRDTRRTPLRYVNHLVSTALAHQF